MPSRRVLLKEQDFWWLEHYISVGLHFGDLESRTTQSKISPKLRQYIPPQAIEMAWRQNCSGWVMWKKIARVRVISRLQQRVTREPCPFIANRAIRLEL